MKIAALYIYPVKGMRAVALDAARVERWGLEGDRRWAVIDADSKVVTQREAGRLATISALPSEQGLVMRAEGAGSASVGEPERGERIRIRIFDDEVEARVADAGAAAWLTDLLGIPCRLVHLASPETARLVASEGGLPGETVSLADAYPVLLASTASLGALNRELGDKAVPMDRFRPNIVVEDCQAWEEERIGQLSAGPVRFRSATPCERCIVTTIDQREGSRIEKVEPLRTLTRLRPSARKKALFGQNLIPENEGVIEVGQSVALASGVSEPRW